MDPPCLYLPSARLILSLLVLEPRTSHMLDKCSTTELHPQPGKPFLCFRKVSCFLLLAFTFCCYDTQHIYWTPTIYGGDVLGAEWKCHTRRLLLPYHSGKPAPSRPSAPSIPDTQVPFGALRPCTSRMLLGHSVLRWPAKSTHRCSPENMH